MIEMNRRSTKAVNGNDLVLYYRQEGDIYRLVHYVLHGDGKNAPVYVGGKGVSLYPQISDQQIAEEMLKIQILHQKCKGLRIRQEFAVITFDELHKGRRGLSQICKIADWYGDYYYYRGFQCVYGVFQEADRYVIRYAINTVSGIDGSKYTYNVNEIRDEEQRCLQWIVGSVIGRESGVEFDFRELEYY